MPRWRLSAAASFTKDHRKRCATISTCGERCFGCEKVEMTTTERRVAIVGAGLIGRAWAAIFGRAGWSVRLTDPHGETLAVAPGLIRDELHALARHGLASDPDGAAARISVAASLAEALEGVE